MPSVAYNLDATGATRGAAQFSRAIDRVVAESRRGAKALGTIDAAMRSMAGSAGASRTMTAAAASIASLGRAVSPASRSVTTFSQNLRNMQSASVLAFGPLSGVGSRLVAVGSAAQRSGAGIVAAGTAFTGLGVALAKSVKNAVAFEADMTRVGKVAGVAGDELKAMSADILQMSSQLGIPTAELSKIEQRAASLGIRGAQNLATFTQQVAILTRTSDDLGAEEAAAALGRFINLTNQSPENIKGIAAALTQLGNDFNTTEGEILTMTEELSRAGVAFKVGGDELLALGTALATVGERPERSATALAQALTRITQAAAGGGAELQAFADVVGLSADEFQKLARDDIGEVFFRLLQSLRAAGPNAIQILDDLRIGSERNTKVFLSTANSLDALVSALETTRGQMANPTAALDEFQRMNETVERQVETLGTQLDNLATILGTPLLPAINSAVTALNEFLLGLQGVETQSQSTAHALGTLLNVQAQLSQAQTDLDVSTAQLELKLQQKFGSEMTIAKYREMQAATHDLEGAVKALGSSVDPVVDQMRLFVESSEAGHASPAFLDTAKAADEAAKSLDKASRATDEIIAKITEKGEVRRVEAEQGKAAAEAQRLINKAEADGKRFTDEQKQAIFAKAAALDSASAALRDSSKATEDLARDTEQLNRALSETRAEAAGAELYNEALKKALDSGKSLADATEEAEIASERHAIALEFEGDATGQMAQEAQKAADRVRELNKERERIEFTAGVKEENAQLARQTAIYNEVFQKTGQIAQATRAVAVETERVRLVLGGYQGDAQKAAERTIDIQLAWEKAEEAAQRYVDAIGNFGSNLGPDLIGIFESLNEGTLDWQDAMSSAVGTLGQLVELFEATVFLAESTGEELSFMGSIYNALFAAPQKDKFGNVISGSGGLFNGGIIGGDYQGAVQGAATGAAAGIAAGEFFKIEARRFSDDVRGFAKTAVTDIVKEGMRGGLNLMIQLIGGVTGAVAGAFTGGAGGAIGGVLGAGLGKLLAGLIGDAVTRDALINRKLDFKGSDGGKAGFLAFSPILGGLGSALFGDDLLSSIFGLPTLGTAYRRQGQGVLERSRVFGGEDGQGGLQAQFGPYTRQGSELKFSRENQRFESESLIKAEKRGLSGSASRQVQGQGAALFSILFGDGDFPEDAGRLALEMGRGLAEFFSRGLEDGLTVDEVLDLASQSFREFAKEAGIDLFEAFHKIGDIRKQVSEQAIKFGGADPLAAEQEGLDAYASSAAGLVKIFEGDFPRGTQVGLQALQAMEKDGVSAFGGLDQAGKDFVVSATTDFEDLEQVMRDLAERGYEINAEKFEQMTLAAAQSAAVIGEALTAAFETGDVDLSFASITSALGDGIRTKVRETFTSQLLDKTAIGTAFQPVFNVLDRIGDFDFVNGTGENGLGAFREQMLAAITEGKGNLAEYLPILKEMIAAAKEIDAEIAKATEPTRWEKLDAIGKSAAADLGDSFGSAIENAVQAGIEAGAEGSDPMTAFTSSLEEGVNAAIRNAIIRAFVEGTLMTQILKPWLDTFGFLMTAGLDVGFDDPRVKQGFADLTKWGDDLFAKLPEQIKPVYQLLEDLGLMPPIEVEVKVRTEGEIPDYFEPRDRRRGGRGISAAATGGTFADAAVVGEAGMPELVTALPGGGFEVTPLSHAEAALLMEDGLPGFARGGYFAPRGGRGGLGGIGPSGPGRDGGMGRGTDIDRYNRPGPIGSGSPGGGNGGSDLDGDGGNAEKSFSVSFSFDEAVENFLAGGSRKELEDGLRKSAGEGLLEGLLEAALNPGIEAAIEKIGKMFDAARSAKSAGGESITGEEMAAITAEAEKLADEVQADTEALAPIYKKVATTFGVELGNATRSGGLEGLDGAIADHIAGGTTAQLRESLRQSTFEGVSAGVTEHVMNSPAIQQLQDRYEDAFSKAMEDGVITAEEAADLDEFGDKLTKRIDRAIDESGIENMDPGANSVPVDLDMSSAVAEFARTGDVKALADSVGASFQDSITQSIINSLMTTGPLAEQIKGFSDALGAQMGVAMEDGVITAQEAGVIGDMGSEFADQTAESIEALRPVFEALGIEFGGAFADQVKDTTDGYNYEGRTGAIEDARSRAEELRDQAKDILDQLAAFNEEIEIALTESTDPLGAELMRQDQRARDRLEQAKDLSEQAVSATEKELEALREEYRLTGGSARLARDIQEAEDRLRIAKESGADIIEIERLNALEREQVIEDFAERANASIRDLLEDLTGTTASPLATQEAYGNALDKFNMLRDAALSGDLAAREALPQAASNLLELAEAMFAKGPKFFEIFDTITATLERILAMPLAETSAMPQLATGGYIESAGVAFLHPGETVVPNLDPDMFANLAAQIAVGDAREQALLGRIDATLLRMELRLDENLSGMRRKRAAEPSQPAA